MQNAVIFEWLNNVEPISNSFLFKNLGIVLVKLFGLLPLHVTLCRLFHIICYDTSNKNPTSFLESSAPATQSAYLSLNILLLSNVP